MERNKLYRWSWCGLIILTQFHFTFAQIVNVSDYGVLPEKSNVTSEIQSLIAKHPGETLFFPKGIYRIKALNVRNSINIIGEEGTIFQPTTSLITMLYITSDSVEIRNVALNGRKSSRIGITIGEEVSSIRLVDLTVSNMYSSTRVGAYGIYITANTRNITIESCKIKNITGIDNGVIGDAMGANRGVYSYPCNGLKIINSEFKNIGNFEDGDAIHIQNLKGNKSNVVNKAIVQDCVFSSIYKRAIKIQTNNVEIINNQISSGGKEQAVHSAISLFGKNITVRNNKINLAWAVSGIEVGNADVVIISGNTIQIDTLNLHSFARRSKMQVGIYLYGTKMTVEHNIIDVPGYGLVSYKGIRECQLNSNLLTTRNKYKIFLSNSRNVNITTIDHEERAGKTHRFFIKDSNSISIDGKNY